MVGSPAMVALVTALGRLIGIRPVRFDDFQVVPNLWGGIIARSGAMKSHAWDKDMKHLKRLATIAHDRLEVERELREAYRDRIEAEITATGALGPVWRSSRLPLLHQGSPPTSSASLVG